jgi:aminoacylase
VTAHGNTGHASRLIDGTAVEQLMGVVNRAMRFRYRQKELLQTKCSHAGGCSHSVAAYLGDVTSLNMTKIHSNSDGSTEAFNVIPAVVQAGFDIRLSPHVDPADMLAEIDTWCREAEAAVTGVPSDGGIKWEFDASTTSMVHSTTSTDSAANPWWGLIAQCLSSEHDITAVPMVFPAATDSRFLREMGIKAFGFSPMRRSPILLHEHDEYLDEAVFLEGCSVYVSLITRLSSQDGSLELQLAGA